jgi:glycosyltransferase involved in cell wall biosynthesis
MVTSAAREPAPGEDAARPAPAAPAPTPQARRRRVLIATDTFPPDVNGAAIFTSRLAHGLAGRGNQVHVICQSDTGPPRVDHVDGVTVHRLRSAPLLVHPTMRVTVAARLARIIDGLIAVVDPDVAHVQGHFPIGRACIKAARRTGVPTIATNHFMPDNLFQYAPVGNRLRSRASELAWRDLTRVFARADRVTTPTPIAAELLTGKGLACEVEAVSCGIDLGRFRPGSEPPSWVRKRLDLPERASVLFVGRLDEEKRLDELIGALPYVVTGIDAQVVLAGAGGRRAALERLAARLGVADRVRFLGFVPDEDLPLVYSAAEVFAMPGVAELQSIATLEAMASGLPVVAADAMALPHLVRPGENGFLYRPGDVPGLARHLTNLLADPALRAAMGRGSHALAAGHDHGRSLDRFEAIYAAAGRGT